MGTVRLVSAQYSHSHSHSNSTFTFSTHSQHSHSQTHTHMAHLHTHSQHTYSHSLTLSTHSHSALTPLSTHTPCKIHIQHLNSILGHTLRVANGQQSPVCPCQPLPLPFSYSSPLHPRAPPLFSVCLCSLFCPL